MNDEKARAELYLAQKKLGLANLDLPIMKLYLFGDMMESLEAETQAELNNIAAKHSDDQTTKVTKSSERSATGNILISFNDNFEAQSICTNFTSLESTVQTGSLGCGTGRTAKRVKVSETKKMAEIFYVLVFLFFPAYYDTMYIQYNYSHG